MTLGFLVPTDISTTQPLCPRFSDYEGRGAEMTKTPDTDECFLFMAESYTCEISTIWLPKQDGHIDNTS